VKVSAASKLKNGGTAVYSGQSAGRSSSVSGTSEVSGAFAEIAGDLETRAIIEELDSIGSELTRYPTSVLLGKYKDLVRMALGLVENGMQIKREFKWRRTERSMYMVIERTEEALGELDELESALGRERDRTKLLSLIDEIKGCLISLLF
jgi:uncharacterized protein YaaR (DUF327 family)